MTVGLATVRRSSMSVAHDSSAPVAQYLGTIDTCRGGSFRAPETGVGHDSDDREIDSDSGLRQGGCLGATTSAASRKAGSLPDPGQGIGGERVGLFGHRSLIAPALEESRPRLDGGRGYRPSVCPGRHGRGRSRLGPARWWRRPCPLRPGGRGRGRLSRARRTLIAGQ